MPGIGVRVTVGVEDCVGEAVVVAVCVAVWVGVRVKVGSGRLTGAWLAANSPT